MLNRLLGAGYLTVDRETVALNPDAGLYLDTPQFRHLLAASDAHWRWSVITTSLG